jgi:outer membrane protein assembly factor BamB
MERVKAAWIGVGTLVLGAAMIALGGPALSSAASSTQWTQFRLNANNNAVMPGDLEASWRVPTGAPFSSSPTLIDGVLYIGNNGGSLYAIDATSGRIRWTFHTRNPIMSAPIAFGNSVIVGVGNENSPMGSSPSHPIHVGSGEGALVAIDRQTGRARWRISLDGSGMPTPAVINGIIVHHDGAGTVMGIDGNTGKTLYRRNLQSIASMVSALPIGTDRFVTAGVQTNTVWQLRARDGSLVWKTDFPAEASGVGDCPAATDGRQIYCDYIMPPSTKTPVTTGTPAVQHVFALDATTGKKMWDYPMETGILPNRNEAAIPLAIDDTLYVGSSLAPWMHAYDVKTGALKWRSQVHGPVKGGIVYVDGTIYFGDLNGYLWALDAHTGNVVGTKNMRSAFNVGSPIVVGKTLFIGTLGGAVLAVPLNDIRTAHDA